MAGTSEFWVFAYGSLIWNPGFEPCESVPAKLSGFHRSFCMRSVVYRGTPDAPGLVLALDRNATATCQGLAYRAGAERADEIQDYLRRRELVSSAYLEQIVPVELADGRAVSAVTYVMDRNHPQYHGSLNTEAQAQIIARAAGPAGSNRDYLRQTVDSLRRLGVTEHALEALQARVEELAAPDGL